MSLTSAFFAVVEILVGLCVVAGLLGAAMRLVDLVTKARDYHAWLFPVVLLVGSLLFWTIAAFVLTNLL